MAAQLSPFVKADETQILVCAYIAEMRMMRCMTPDEYGARMEAYGRVTDGGQENL